MSIQRSKAFYPKQPGSLRELALDDSYFLIRLCRIHSFFDIGWLTKPGHLIFSSSIESSFSPNQEIISLHQITSLQSRKPLDLDLQMNLTDWIPSRSTEWLRVKLKFTLIQDAPFILILNKLQEDLLTIRLSLSASHQQLLAKISDINQQLLTAITNEVALHEIVMLTLQLNLATTKRGYYLITDAQCSSDWQRPIQLNANGEVMPATAADIAYSAGISTSIMQQLRSVLLECGLLSSDNQLQTLFRDPRIAPWYPHLQNAASISDRVDRTIALLINQYNKEYQKNALVLLLNVLGERFSPAIDTHHLLVNTAEMLELELIGEPRQNQAEVQPFYPNMDVASVQQCPYAVIEVMSLKRRGSESARREPWWKLLQMGKEQAMMPPPDGESLERRKILDQWYRNLTQVRSLVQHERAYLLSEIDEIIQTAHVEVETNLLPRTRGSKLSKEWQIVLGVETREELSKSVQNYQATLLSSSHDLPVGAGAL